MKIGVFFNVYKNYSDVLLGSEILRNFERKQNIFNEIKIWAGGGFEKAPTKKQCQFLDEYFDIQVDPSINLKNLHIKYIGCYRVLAGIVKALIKGKKNNLDYVIVTNADAWILDDKKLEVLLSSNNLKDKKISIRCASGTGLWINNFSYSPYVDDHFVIFNLRKISLEQIKQIEGLSKKRPIFLTDGGIHYFLLDILERTFSSNDVYIYSDGNRCVNQYGEICGGSLLPLNYQIDTGFLHANCEQMHSLNPIRARFLVYHRLNKLKYCQIYCEEHLNDNIKTIVNLDNVFVKRSIKDWTFILIYKFYSYANLLKINYMSDYKKIVKLTSFDEGYQRYIKTINNLPVYFISRK